MWHAWKDEWKRSLGRLGLRWEVLLKWILRKQGGKSWTGFT
jgi:hypothetical protein